MLLSAKASPKHESADATMEESNEVRRPSRDTTRPRAGPRGVATQKRRKLVSLRKGLGDVAKQQKLPSAHDGQQQIVLRKHYDPEASSVRFGAEEILLLESRNAEEEAWQRDLLEMHVEGRSSSSPVTPTTPGSVGEQHSPRNRCMIPASKREKECSLGWFRFCMMQRIIMPVHGIPGCVQCAPQLLSAQPFRSASLWPRRHSQIRPSGSHGYVRAPSSTR